VDILDGVLEGRHPRRVVGRGLRVFSASPGTRRYRRASDVVLLVPALVFLGGLIAAYPPARLESSLARFLDSTPGWLDPVWGFAYDLFGLWAIALVVVAIVGRRVGVAVEAAGAVGAAVLVALVSARIATGSWPGVDAAVLLRADDASFPLVRVALCTAVILTVGPHLVRPLERTGRWVLLLGILGATLVRAGDAERDAHRLPHRRRRGGGDPARVRDLGRPSRALRRRGGPP
jgi:hypothetical protein